MQRNVGGKDRTLRLAFGSALVGAGYFVEMEVHGERALHAGSFSGG